MSYKIHRYFEKTPSGKIANLYEVRWNKRLLGQFHKRSQAKRFIYLYQNFGSSAAKAYERNIHINWNKKHYIDRDKSRRRY